MTKPKQESEMTVPEMKERIIYLETENTRLEKENDKFHSERNKRRPIKKGSSRGWT